MTTPTLALRYSAAPALFALGVLTSACSGSAARSEAKAPEAEPGDERGERGGISAMAEIGGLNEEKVTATFEASQAGLQRCMQSGAGRVEFLGGEIAFLVKIDMDGKVAHVHAERSSIGDRDTERCMFKVLRDQSWPPAEGGKVGIAKNSIAFEMLNDVREPTPWEGTVLDETLEKLSGDIGACKTSGHGRFHATAYVDTEGHALGVGMAPPDDAGEDSVDCLVSLLKKAKYPSPGSWPAKVMFEL